MSPFPSRRQFLRHTGLGAAGLLLANWVRAQSSGPPQARGRARAVILIFNCGAPSHLDLWDMKPAAEARGSGGQPCSTCLARRDACVTACPGASS
jgi:hypothetical protein